VTRLDAYLASIGSSLADQWGADWSKPPLDPAGNAIPCAVGSVPIQPDYLTGNHNAQSTLFQKMQSYLYKPVGTYGALGPQDFIVANDADFYNAYYQIMPYYVYGDPDANQFTTREGGGGTFGAATPMQHLWAMLGDEARFHQIAAVMDTGDAPYDDVMGVNGPTNAAAFLDDLKKLSINHRAIRYTKQYAHPHLQLDGAGMDFTQIMQRAARHCSGGTWETKAQWQANLVQTYWSQTIWHEFGHSMGLDHNFMASIDRPNFPVLTDSSGQPIPQYKWDPVKKVYAVALDSAGKPVQRYGLYANSVMEYNSNPDRVFWEAGWPSYDAGAIAWIYANNTTTRMAPPANMTAPGISGQFSKTVPWNDPKGYDATGKEISFLFCNASHTKYTPFCRAGDSGSTPSEISANELDAYEWQYNWRNFRQYRKYWDESHYADAPLNYFTEARRFMSAFAFDWTPQNISDIARRLGIGAGNTDIQDYLNQLGLKFVNEFSQAMAIQGAASKAIVQQGSGERPIKTIYDPYYGDVTQQGIILDKNFAVQQWSALWPVDNYDQTQAGGAYLASYSSFSSEGGGFFQTVAEDAIDSMVGGQYNTFPYAKPLAVVQFTRDTHDPAFGGRIEIRDWVGGHIFYRFRDFLDFFAQMAVSFNFASPANGVDCTHEFINCNYDPTHPRAFPSDTFFSDSYNEFVGPDGRRYAWSYLADRNTWVVVDRDRNTASYLIVRTYNADVIHAEDDGNIPGLAFTYQLPLKYFLDTFAQYN